MEEYKTNELVNYLQQQQEQRIKDGIPKEEVDSKISKQKILLFDVDEYMKGQSDASWKTCCRFTNDQLTQIARIIESRLPKSRGPSKQVTVKSMLFLTLCYYSSNQQLHWVAKQFKLNLSTLMGYVEVVRDIYFPILYEIEIGEGKLIPSVKKFTNFPDCVGALDSTLIRHYQPSDPYGRRRCFSEKHKGAGVKLQALVNPDGLAVNIYIEKFAAKHDCLVAVESNLRNILTEFRGQQIINKSILCDKGYVGLEKHIPGAIIMERDVKGSEIDKEETGDKDRSSFIAADRIIVERFFGRLKMSWACLHSGYRGDTAHVQNIIKGLVALTNRLIKFSPLTKADNLQEQNHVQDITQTGVDNCGEDKNEQTIIELGDTSDSKNENDDSLKEMQMKSIPRYPRNPKTVRKSFPKANDDVDLPCIANQGATCHLNTLIQLLYSLSDVRQMLSCFTSDTDEQPALSLNDIFQAMEDIRTKHLKQIIDTKQLTDALGNRDYWLSEENFCESFEKLVTNLRANILNKSGKDIFSIFAIRTTQSERPILTFNALTGDFLDLLTKRLQKGEKYIFPKVIVINVEASELHKINMHRTLNLEAIAGEENKVFDLNLIIGYKNRHYVIYKRFDNQWYKLNDRWATQVEEEEIQSLAGSNQDHFNADSLIYTVSSEPIIGGVIKKTKQK